MAYNFGNLITRVHDRTGISTSDSDRVTQIRAAINDTYKKWASAKQWEELTTTATINVKGRYNTGSIDFTNGDADIAGNSTVWTSALHLDWIVKPSGYEETYAFSAVASNTAATLDQEYNGSTSAENGYILYQPKYSLTSNFDEFIDPHHTFWPYEPEAVTIDAMRRLYSNFPTTEGKCQAYTIFDFDSSNNKQVIIWPIPEEDYNLKYDYKKTITELVSDSDIPLISDNWRERILVEGALAIMYEIIGDPRLAAQERTAAGNIASMMARQEATERHTRMQPANDYRGRRLPAGVRIDNSWFSRRRLNVP